MSLLACGLDVQGHLDINSDPGAPRRNALDKAPGAPWREADSNVHVKLSFLALAFAVSAKIRNRRAHAANGNQAAKQSLRPSELKAKIRETMTACGTSQSQTEFLYNKLHHETAPALLQSIVAQTTLLQRKSALRMACDAAGVRLGDDVEGLLAGGVAAVGMRRARELFFELSGGAAEPDTAAALVTTQQIVPPGETEPLAAEMIQIPFLTARTGELTVLTRCLTQFGADRVQLAWTPHATTGPAKAKTTRMIGLISGDYTDTKMYEFLCKADDEGWLEQALLADGTTASWGDQGVFRRWISEAGTGQRPGGAEGGQDGHVPKLYQLYRSPAAKKPQAASAFGNRTWSCSFEVDTTTADYLMAQSGFHTPGIFCRKMDMADAKRTTATVGNEGNYADAANFVRQAKACDLVTAGLWPSTNGVLRARGEPAALDTMRAELLGARKAAQQRCTIYKVGNAPTELSGADVAAHLRTWEGFKGCRVVEPVSRRPFYNRATRTNTWQIRCDCAIPIVQLPAFVSEHKMSVGVWEKREPPAPTERAAPPLTDEEKETGRAMQGRALHAAADLGQREDTHVGTDEGEDQTRLLQETREQEDLRAPFDSLARDLRASVIFPPNVAATVGTVREIIPANAEGPNGPADINDADRVVMVWDESPTVGAPKESEYMRDAWDTLAAVKVTAPAAAAAGPAVALPPSAAPLPPPPPPERAASQSPRGSALEEVLRTERGAFGQCQLADLDEEQLREAIRYMDPTKMMPDGEDGDQMRTTLAELVARRDDALLTPSPTDRRARLDMWRRQLDRTDAEREVLLQVSRRRRKATALAGRAAAPPRTAPPRAGAAPAAAGARRAPGNAQPAHTMPPGGGDGASAAAGTMEEMRANMKRENDAHKENLMSAVAEAVAREVTTQLQSHMAAGAAAAILTTAAAGGAASPADGADAQPQPQGDQMAAILNLLREQADSQKNFQSQLASEQNTFREELNAQRTAQEAQRARMEGIIAEQQ
eukprot:gene3877-6558_t